MAVAMDAISSLGQDAIPRKGFQHYVLTDGVVRGTNDINEFIAWSTREGEMGWPNKRIGNDAVGKGRVSTVFLSLDHGFGVENPVLFETMIFGLKGGAEWQRRYVTLAEAKRGHEKAVRILKRFLRMGGKLANSKKRRK